MAEPARPSQKSVFIWNIIGSFCNALSSMILLVFVNRILGSSTGDTFSIGFSIATLMAAIGLFQVRVYQSTDVTARFTFRDYFSLRILSCGAMFLVSVFYIWARGYETSKYVIVLLLCLYKLVDAFSDVFQGLFQQKDRLDLSGKAIAVRILISNGAFFLSLLITKDLMISSGVLFAGALAAILLFDVPNYRRMARLYPEMSLNGKIFQWQQLKLLVVICFPLFLNAYLMNAVYNLPKLAIDTAIENGSMKEGLQSYYNILFMPASVINLFLIVFRPLLTVLAHHFVDRSFQQFGKILGKIILGLAGFGLLALAGAALLGIPVLSIIYGTGDGLYPYKIELLLLIVGGGINSIANMLDNAITIIRKQQYLIIGYVAAWVAARILARPMVSSYGIRGAVITFVLSVSVLLVSVGLIYLFSMRAVRRTGEIKV